MIMVAMLPVMVIMASMSPMIDFLNSLTWVRCNMIGKLNTLIIYKP